jgi:D-xylose transport system permease protein
MKKNFSTRDIALGLALILITIFFVIQDRAFISPGNLSNLSIELAITATLALGMLLVLLPGMIDLSVGSGVGMLGGIAAVLIINYHLSASMALLLTLVIGIAIWSLMGALIVRQKVPAFIITLGGLLIFQGIHWLVIENATVPVAPGGTENIFSMLTTYYFPPKAGWCIAAFIGIGIIMQSIKTRSARKKYGFKLEDKEIAFMKIFILLQATLLLVLILNQHKGLPLSLVILGVVAFGIYILTQHTAFGRYLYAIGGNEEAAILSGISVEKTIVCAFILLGCIVTLTGFMQTAYGGYSTTTVGKLMELDAIAACVIGGTSLKGGRGNVMGVMIGALIMAVLLNGMTLLAVSPETKFIARGTVLVIAVWMDVFLSKKTA